MRAHPAFKNGPHARSFHSLSLRRVSGWRATLGFATLMALPACDLLKKADPIDASPGATPTPTIVATTTPTIDPATAPTGTVPTLTPTPVGVGTKPAGTPQPKTDGGVVALPTDGGKPGLTIPTALPSGFPTALPSGFPTALPSGFPTALPSGFPQFPIPGQDAGKK